MRGGPVFAGVAIGGLGVCGLAGCGSLPWGQGGGALVAESREVRQGFARDLGEEGLAHASERLGLAVAEPWSEVALPVETLVGGAVHVGWNDLRVDVGQVLLDLGPGGLEARVQVAAEPATLALATPAMGSCELALELGPGTWVAPLELGADKLGRVQVAVGAGVRYEGTVVASADCVPDSALQALVPDAVAQALEEALGGSLANALVPALGLDLALTWSSPVAADGLGTGFVRASVRAREAALATVGEDRISVGFAVGFEAEPHPCMAPLALPAPASDERAASGEAASDGAGAPAGGAGGALRVRLAVLEQGLEAAWVAGAACAEHVASALGPVSVSELAIAWPALGRFGDGRVRLELWPEELPTVAASDAGGLEVATGRVVVDVWVEDGGAWWRAATVAVALRLTGELTVTPDGFVWLDPTGVEAAPESLSAGLVDAPEGVVVTDLLAPLLQAMVAGRPLFRLPPSLTPSEVRAFAFDGDQAILSP